MLILRKVFESFSFKKAFSHFIALSLAYETLFNIYISKLDKYILKEKFF